MDKKKILLLGGSAQQIIAIKTAKNLGYYTILCDYLSDNPGQYVADKFYLVSTTDRKSVFEIAKNEGISGVLAYASDPAAPIAAYVAERLKLHGNPLEAVETLCNKDMFRNFLVRNGFEAPVAYGYGSKDDVMKDKKRFVYPIILKPVDSSGSKGVTVVHLEERLEKAVDFAFSYSRCHRIIVESYIEKKHKYLVGGDIFVSNGKIILWGLLNCHRDNNVNPLVPVGKSYPLMLGNEDVINIKNTLENLVACLKMTDGSMNVELVVDNNDKVWLIDVGPRSGGNMIPDLLGDMFGVDIAKMSIQAAMGYHVEESLSIPSGCYATYNLHSDKSGVYYDIWFSTEIEKYIYRKCIYKKRGESVEFFDNAAKCLGIVFMKFPDEVTMNNIYMDIQRHIRIILQ